MHGSINVKNVSTDPPGTDRGFLGIPGAHLEEPLVFQICSTVELGSSELFNLLVCYLCSRHDLLRGVEVGSGHSQARY